MNLSLNPHELLHTFELLVKNQMIFPEDHEVLLNKFRSTILDSLTKEQDRLTSMSFQAWEGVQEKKIKDLSQQNAEIIKDITPPKNAAK